LSQFIWRHGLGIHKKSLKAASMIWKAVINSFPIIEEGLAWKIGNVQRVRLRTNPCPGCERQHILLEHLVNLLRTQGYDTLNKLAVLRLATIWSQGWKSERSLGLEEEDVT